MLFQEKLFFFSTERKSSHLKKTLKNAPVSKTDSQIENTVEEITLPASLYFKPVGNRTYRNS